MEDGEEENEGNLPRAQKVGTVIYEMGQKSMHQKHRLLLNSAEAIYTSFLFKNPSANDF